VEGQIRQTVLPLDRKDRRSARSTNPIGEKGGTNLYGYTGGDPVNAVDPSGHELLGAGIGAVAGGLGDLAWQLAGNGGNINCVDWGQVAAVALIGVGVGLIGPAALEALAPEAEEVAVSRWGRPGLQAGDWVMKGPVSPQNYIGSGKWFPNPGNEVAGYSTGETFTVPSSSLDWPSGWDWPKGLLGQRIYFP